MNTLKHRQVLRRVVPNVRRKNHGALLVRGRNRALFGVLERRRRFAFHPPPFLAGLLVIMIMRDIVHLQHCRWFVSRETARHCARWFLFGATKH